ncbi:coiled-coil domain-containing protein 15 isoform X3 [Perca flavescens]|uniref:coiled-coil domain-containing protein 15 isoform X3 n=1 Tax=Perca flavescens TaxID=8167 RepID=UPI00106DDE2D|nr:coiled-coil domain-containing protein 15 isoform X3 [Perca flavescens]
MSTSRLITSTNGRCKASVSRNKEHPVPRGANKVLAQRNHAVVAVGAWVEGGQDFVEHPSSSHVLVQALALLTEEIQAEKRRETEESLRRFQDEVRHRVAQQAQVSKKRQQPPTDSVMKPERRIPHQQDHVWTQHVSAGERLMSAGDAAHRRLTEGSPQESSGGMRQVRLRLAACRMIPHGEMSSDLPGGKWNISSNRHKPGSHVLRAEQEEAVQEEEEEEEGDDHLFTSQHKCPLVQQKVSGPVLWDSDKSQPGPGFKSNLRAPPVLWPLTDQEELKRQRQSQFLVHRRQYMNIEREQVKENKQNRKHLKRTARIKAEKEQIRLEEERKLERVRQLAEARQRLEERELLILERLKLEEEERAVELQRRKREEKGKVTARFIEALRAQMKERLSQERLEPPPLCCCASSFWDSHPDTCANNCVFHNNPKAYAKALHSTMLSLELQ